MSSVRSRSPEAASWARTASTSPSSRGRPSPGAGCLISRTRPTVCVRAQSRSSSSAGTRSLAWAGAKCEPASRSRISVQRRARTGPWPLVVRSSVASWMTIGTRVPIVIHDATLDRTTSGHGPVRARRWTEIRDLDAGSHFAPAHASERVPALEELLDWARTQTVGLVLEIKQPAPGDGRPRDEGLVEAVLAQLAASGLLERTLLISFDHPSIREATEREPRAR